jgi:hypothetical protein
MVVPGKCLRAYTTHMRRLLICLLIALLPVQWGWALGHDASHGVKFDHIAQMHMQIEMQMHADAHDHAAHSDADDAGLAGSCEACVSHCAHSHALGLASASAGWAAIPCAEDGLSPPIAVPPQGAAKRIERPKWPITAQSGQ